MLTPAQVIPFLTHDDAEIRRRARQFLSTAHDPSPVTADDFWAAADNVPPDEVGACLDRLGFVPQTEVSVRRLVDELPKADLATQESLLRTLEQVDFSLLATHRELVLSAEGVPAVVREHLLARLELGEAPVEPLWDRLSSFAAGLGERTLTEDEEREADRLIEAVARHDVAFGDRVLAALNDPEVGGWAELLYANAAGDMHLAAAIDPLLDRLENEDDDAMWEVAVDALVRIGTAEVVDKTAARFDGATAGFRISAADVLGRIKRPESQEALTRLLTSEADLDAVSTIVIALLDLIPDDEATFATLRAIEKEGGYDRSEVHLDEELLALVTFTGRDLPDAAEMRHRIADRRARWALGQSNVEQSMSAAAPLGPSTLHAAPPAPDFSREPRGTATATAARPRSGLQPLRNPSTKVGRNDPCPCGSGKKYKKCCGK